MKSAKMAGPSQEELDAQAAQTAELQKRNAALDAEDAARKAETERQTQQIQQNRVGMRSLLTNDWQGFSRSGDLGAKP